jgi:hypothetical protein
LAPRIYLFEIKWYLALIMQKMHGEILPGGKKRPEKIAALKGKKAPAAWLRPGLGIQ